MVVNKSSYRNVLLLINSTTNQPFMINMYDFLSSMGHKRRNGKELYGLFFSMHLQWMEPGVSNFKNWRKSIINVSWSGLYNIHCIIQSSQFIWHYCNYFWFMMISADSVKCSLEKKDYQWKATYISSCFVIFLSFSKSSSLLLFIILHLH